jgi:hypothetical protein
LFARLNANANTVAAAAQQLLQWCGHACAANEWVLPRARRLGGRLLGGPCCSHCCPPAERPSWRGAAPPAGAER